MYGHISKKFAKNWGEFAAAALLAATPLATILRLLQRYIASRLVAGPVKQKRSGEDRPERDATEPIEAIKV